MPARGPFVPIPHCAKLEVIGHTTATGLPVVQVLHGLVTASPSASNLQDMATAIATELSSFHADFPSSWTIDLIIATDLNAATGNQVTHVYSGTQPDGNPVLPGACGVTELFTALRGKRYTGRIYWPLNGTHYDNTNGTLNATGISQYDAIVSGIQTALVGLTPPSTLRVVSRKLASGNDVVSHATRPKVGYIHRREFA